VSKKGEQQTRKGFALLAFFFLNPCAAVPEFTLPIEVNWQNAPKGWKWYLPRDGKADIMTKVRRQKGRQKVFGGNYFG